MSNEIDKFKQNLINDITHSISARLCSIGIDLGLFDDLSKNGPSTSSEIALRKKYNERYVREWLYGISKAGYLDFNKKTRKASINKFYEKLLVTEGEKDSVKGFFKVVNNMMLPYELLLRSFRNGGGIKYEEYNEQFWKGLDLTGCSRYRSFLVPEWIDLIPDIKSLLHKGITFADFGCGTGRSTVELAKKFKNSTFFGFDKFQPNIKDANLNAKEANVSDNTCFKLWDAKSGSPGNYDIVAAFDLIHDLPNPLEGIKTIKKSLKKDGKFILMDVKCTEDPIDNNDPMVLFKFGASLHFCMTTSLAYEGEGLGTVGLPYKKVKKLCLSAGFTKVDEIDLKHPINSFFVIS